MWKYLLTQHIPAPPQSRLPFVHPKWSKRQNLTLKSFDQRLNKRNLEKWHDFARFCRLMSVPILTLQDSLSSTTMQWKWLPQTRFKAAHVGAVQRPFVINPYSVLVLKSDLDIHQLRLVVDVLLLHQLLHRHQGDICPPITLAFAVLLAQSEAFDWLLLVVLDVLEVVEENLAEGILCQILAFFRCCKCLGITFNAIAFFWTKSKVMKVGFFRVLIFRLLRHIPGRVAHATLASSSTNAPKI